MAKSSRLLPILAGVVLAGAAAPVRGDEIQYLPNGAHVVFSVNFQNLLKSKTFAELKKMMKELPGAKEDIEAEMERGIGIPASNIARLTMGIAFKQGDKGANASNEVGVITTNKAVKADDIIAAKKQKPISFKKNITYKEVKIGKFTVYEENFQFQFNENDKPGDVQKGGLFCVVEEKLVLFSDGRRGADSLKQILERNGKPELSKNVALALQYAPLSNTGVVAIDLQGMPERERNNMFRGFGMIGLKDLGDSFQAIALKANEMDKFMGQAALFCKDADSAGKAKKAIESGLADLKSKLKDDPKLPASIQDLMKAAREGLDAIKVSTAANQVNASVSIEPALIGKLFFGVFAAGASAPPPAKEEVKELKEKK